MKKSPLVGIDALQSAAGYSCVIDVRSPSEFADDHVPSAINCPVLDDEERARVGTIYKQDSPFAARKIGAALVSRNIARHIETQFGSRRNLVDILPARTRGAREGPDDLILVDGY